MQFIRRAAEVAIAMLALTLFGILLLPARSSAQDVSAQNWQSPNSTPGAEEIFECVYQRAWPCKASAESAPSVDQILERYQQSLGGAAALAKVKTRILAQRRFQDIGTPEDHYLLRLTKRPASEDERLLSIQTHTSLDGTFLRWSNGCDAEGGWNWSGRNDPSGVVKAGKLSTDGLCEQELYYYGYFAFDLTHFKKAFQRFEFKGIHKIFQPDAGPEGVMAGGKGPDIIPPGQARDAYLLLAVPTKNGDDYEWLYFDTKTGLLLRFASVGDVPLSNAGHNPDDVHTESDKLSLAGNTARIVDFIQYRKVGDGTILPFQFVNQGPTTRVRGVTVNVIENAPIDDKAFTRPKNSLRADMGFKKGD